jgi:hypothetical protein
MIRDVREVGRLPTGEAADQGNERVEMTFALARDRRRKELHARCCMAR